MRHGINNYQGLRRLLIFGALTLWLTVLAGNLPALVSGNRSAGISAQELSKLNRFIQSAKDDALKVFRQGRDQIEDENWNGAAATFNSFVADYPKHKDVDAALYWLAFALKKQSKFAEADGQLERLIREYPRSNWVDDARAMRVEIAPQTGNPNVIQRELQGDHEIKMIALQSLFQSNPERAAEIAAEILKPESKADGRLKENAVALLGQHSGPRATPILINIARNQPDPKLRKTAIFWLGQHNNEAAVDELMKIYENEQNVEIKNQILFALSQNSSPRARTKLGEIARSGGDIEVRKQAIFGISQRGGDTSVDELIKIFDADSNTEIRKQVLFALTQINSSRARAKLLDAARTADDVEVRKQAIFWIGQQGGDQAVEILIQLYDSEKDVDLKEQIIFALNQSRQKSALRKLMQIGKSDGSMELRKKAIFWLGQSKDPDAAKFIEEILK